MAARISRSSLSPSVAGATLRASRAITNPIAKRSRIAAPPASRIVLFELVVSVGFVTPVVVETVLDVVSVFSEAPLSASLNAFELGVDAVPAVLVAMLGLLAVAALVLDATDIASSRRAAVRDSRRSPARDPGDASGDEPFTRRAYRLGDLVSSARTSRTRASAPRALKP